MLLWILLLGGLALTTAVVWLALSMGRAERRARRALFRAVGLDETMVELLMDRDGDVLAELTLVRRAEAGAHPPLEPTSEGARRRAPQIRLVHPAGPAQNPDSADPPAGGPDRRGGDRRRLRPPGRDGRS
jgi:hypothetical protein